MIRKLKLTTLAVAALALSSCTTSPTGRSQLMLAGGDLSEQGAQSFEELKQNEKISQDPALTRYVQCVTQHIIQHVPEKYGYQPNQWEVVLFDSDQINAFALPGAKIGVYTGLLKVAQDQDQLASVIGHEVGHVLAKHSNERMSNQMLAGLATAAVGVAAGDSEHKDKYLMAIGLGATYGFLMPYSRIHESEADEIGQDIMARAGFNPQGAVSMWQNMAAASGGKTPPELLSTHPSPKTRIDKLSKGLNRYTPMYQQAKARGKTPSCSRP